jgi:hypothetical protein
LYLYLAEVFLRLKLKFQSLVRYEDKSEKVVCQVCKQVFKYDASLEQGRKQSASLSHLKENLKLHLVNSATHKAALNKNEAKAEVEKKEDSRNEKISMALGRTAFYLLSNARPCSDFTQLLSMQHSNGCDIGDINHSPDFISNLAKSFSKVITSRIKNHLSSRLKQTGWRMEPPTSFLGTSPSCSLYSVEHLRELGQMVPLQLRAWPLK